MAYDLKKEEDVTEYLKNLGIEYRFGCYKEKNPEVCHLLADYFESISKDYKKALKVYKSTCDDHNFPRSCYKTASYYLSGKGVDQSAEKSLYYYDKGCSLGDADSCFRSGYLSILNSKSPHPTRTVVQGVEQLKKSCDGRNGDACHHLSSVFMDGNPKENDFVAKDMAKAFQYAIKACDLGNIYACANVSIMYKRGDGVDKDQAQSDKYKNIALEKKRQAEVEKQLVFQEGLSN